MTCCILSSNQILRGSLSCNVSTAIDLYACRDAREEDKFLLGAVENSRDKLSPVRHSKTVHFLLALVAPASDLTDCYTFFSGAEPGPASKPEGSDISRSSKSIAASFGFMPGSLIL